ncbi:acyltransferase family protein [Rhizobium sp. 11515TR]|uniref:acyltransferase family protein n=1 Tax=Rhizobium sp. 11515TR TaxID=2028343 RepID=UPI001FCE9EFB|nr:acyltransferase [Rhizobium sp. 11515TR]
MLFSHATIAGLYKVEPIWGIVKWSPLKILWSGHQAVILFFVLSGFALTKMWGAIGYPRYDAYIASRVIRLYLPYIASLALAVLVYAILRHWFSWENGWMGLPNPILGNNVNIGGHLAMIGVFNPAEINPPIWSIIHEMRISIVFPVIYYIVKRVGWFTVPIFSALSLVVAWSISGPIPLTPLDAELLISLHYVTFFAAGSLIAFNQHRIEDVFSALHGRKRLALWIAAAMAYAYPFDNPWSLSLRMIGDLGTGIGSFVMICLMLHSKEGAWASRRRFLGKISFSFYLNHVLALNICLLAFYDRYGSLSIWLTSVPLALGISWAIYVMVERPAIRLSRLMRTSILGKARQTAAA